ncbi:LysR substrate-binding domain-containing protein [Curvibacter fontanus]|jgi:DNA-binding transcriptional LysR family regulator
MNLHRLDLVSLSLFTLVARTGSISKGAELANLAVGAASKRITDLEAALGATLLERHSRGVVPTLAGQELLRHAQRILHDVDQLAADMSDHAQGVLGVVRLWANTSAITQFLPGELAAFAKAHPGIRIELHEHDSPAVAMAVLDGRADLGVVADRTPTPGLRTWPYRQDRLVLVVPQRHPLARRREVDLADATAYDFVSLAQGTSLAQRLARETTQLGLGLRVRIHVRSFDAMCQMVAAGLGIAVLPDLAVQPHLRSMALRRIALRGSWAERCLLLCARDAAALARPARTLMDHLLVSPTMATPRR